jgi:predicted DNA-binding ribbon-helix-helix protein
MKKRSVKIAGHPTSITLEDEFWTELKAIAEDDGLSLNTLITRIDENRTTENLSSAIRVHILKKIKQAEA